MWNRVVQKYRTEGVSAVLRATLDRLRRIVQRLRYRLTCDLPIPPGPLMEAVAGTNHVGWFLQSGSRAAESIREILDKNGLQIDNFHAVLDFGCGSGRVIRYWKSVKGPIFYGQDYNAELIAWCQRNLKFARFQVGPLVGRLDYDDESFDLIYALSVVTHLTEPTQLSWMRQFFRVLRPGGYLLITTHGEFYTPHIPPADQPKFHNGELVVVGKELEGTNACAAFHPEKYVRRILARDFEVVDFVAEGAWGNPRQDVYLLRKPAPPASRR